MAIYERQYSKLLTRELLKYLLAGSLPNIAEISSRLDELFKKNGNITYKYLPQLKGEVFNNQLFNRQLNAINFDIETVNEELIDLISSAFRRLNYADTYYRVHSHELNKLESLLNAILFTFDKADYFFLGAFDSFTDYAKTDVEKSDPNIINLSEKALMLPYGGKNTLRIKTSHMYDIHTWPVKVVTPIQYISSNQVSSTSFGDIFNDVATGWLYEVVSNKQESVTISFTFPLAGTQADNIEVLVNRFELTPHSATQQKAKIEFSVDDINYKTPEGYEDGVMMKDQKFVYGLDFTTELVQFVRITLTKDTFDEELGNNEDKRFIYRFGLKGFGAYTVGRVQSAVYQSKPFDFSSEQQNISRVSIKADTSTPEGTKIDFSVALSDGTTTSNFIPIKPVKGDAKPGSSEVVVFGTTKTNTLRFEADSSLFSQYTNGTIRGHTFYKYSQDVSPAPIFGSSQLIRGYKAWSRDTSSAIQTTKIADNYVSFAEGDIQKVYAIYTETPTFISDRIGNVDITRLVTSIPVYYNGKGPLIPIGNQYNSTGSDATPSYAVYKVLYITDQGKKTFTVTANASKIKLNYDSFVANGASAPIVKNSSNTVTYKEGKDYIIETEIKDGILRTTGNLDIPTGSQINTSTAPTLNITITLDPDVTYKVTGVNGTVITLNNMKFNAGDTFQVTYRFVPTSPYEIIKSSVKVKNNIQSSGKSVKTYIEGIDYVFDVATGSIQRLPNSTIPSQGEVFIDYFYTTIDNAVETFLTWCYISEEKGLQIKLELDTASKKNTLTSDDTVGERFFVNGAGGLVDLTRATVTPLLGPGWVQFLVRSKNPDVNQKSDNKGNLIDQIIQLRDYDKKRIFKENGKYFKEILAFRDPMIQRSLNHLKSNTLVTDHTVFAFDDITDISKNVLVLNFKPGSTKDLYLKAPQEDSSATLTPLTINEIYQLIWDSKLPNIINGSSVIVKCQLTREPNIDGGITPKVFEYFLRAGD